MAVSRDNLPDGLLETVKNYLNITWSDSATDAKIRGIIASGMMYLNGKAGAEMDYVEDGAARTLLFEYARYMRDEALDVFENNYQSMILAMQTKKELSRYVESTKQTP